MLETTVDRVKLANDLDIKVYNAKFGRPNVQGLVARRNGKTSIYVKTPHDIPARKRFTIAHELGHFLLHLAGGEGDFVDDANNFRTPVDPDAAWTPERRQEWEANAFAAALLMDGNLVVRRWREVPDVRAMASLFQCPEAWRFVSQSSVGRDVTTPRSRDRSAKSSFENAAPTVVGEIKPGDPDTWQPGSLDEWVERERVRTFLTAWTEQMAHERRLRSLCAALIFILVSGHTRLSGSL